MTFHEIHRYTLLTIFLGFLIIDTNARSWDLAVAIGHEIDFFSQNKTLTGQAKIAESTALAGVAYDALTRTMYLTDPLNNVSIFSNDLTEKNFTPKPLLRRQNKSYILGILFDPTSRTLFWCDTNKEVIMKMGVPSNGSAENPVVLHNLTSMSPRSIALDACNSHVYWVNSNNTNPSIERSNIDGSDRVTIIKENLYEPLAVTIDHFEKKLYWIDDTEGITFKIERSNLDGTERELMLYSKRQEPDFLAVDRDSIYWSDRVHRSVWMLPKHRKENDVPVIFTSYFKSHPDADPAGIITRDNMGNIDCAAIAKMEKRTNSSKSVPMHVVEKSYNNLTTSTEESELTTESSKYCLNDGLLGMNGTCRCKLGFSGDNCETFLCHNYCLRGNCHINSLGLPECECTGTFVGKRCEKDACEGHCLHEGKCSLKNEQPICKCKYSNGARCENLNDIAEICAILCASEKPIPSDFSGNPCRCTETNQTAAKMVTFSDNVDYGTLLPIFYALIAVLVLLIVVLSYYVNKLRRRPRIKKRFVVSKGGVTPLTSRPQIPDNQCEITIENCCNMNICETPCFEPKLRAPGSRNSSKKEEKNSLLDNMAGNSC